MKQRTGRAIGIAVGCVAALALSRAVERQPRPMHTGVLLADCEGTLSILAIQYVREADAAAAVYREFLPRLPADVQVCVLCPDQAAYGELVGRIGKVTCRLTPIITGHPMTCWSRDRWLALAPGRADEPGMLLSPCEEAGADLWPARAGDGRVAGELAGHLERTIASRSSLAFDGGDFVSDSDTVFVAPNVLRRNLQRAVADRAELTARLQAMLGRPVVLLDGAPDHHAGMFMMACGDRTVLVGDPSLARDERVPDLPGGADFTDATQRRFDSVAAAASKAGYRAIRMPLVPAADGRTYLTWLNVILDRRGPDRIVYMPVYRGVESLNDKAAAIWQSAGYEVCRVDCTDVFRQFGSLRCLVNVVGRRMAERASP